MATPFNRMDTRTVLAWGVFLLSLATILGAWGFELIGGYTPCHLCLGERIPYYVGVPIAAFAVFMAMTGRVTPTRILLLIVAGNLHLERLQGHLSRRRRISLVARSADLLGQRGAGDPWCRRQPPGPARRRPPRGILHRRNVALPRRLGPVIRRMECGDFASWWRQRHCSRRCGPSDLTDRARYPSRDSRASSHADSSAGTAGRFDADRRSSAGKAIAPATCRRAWLTFRLCANCRSSRR